MAIARKHKLWVIEDCAQAHLAKIGGRNVGTFGNIATFSFYPGKNLGAMGDAGAIVTSDDSLATRMAMFARHGGLRKGDHQIEGINSRLDGLQAAILSVKLQHLPQWTRTRQAIAREYGRLLAGLPAITTPAVAPGREHVYHLYVIRHDRRDELARHLGSLGIQTVINYPIALPFVPAYEYLGNTPAQFPNAHRNQSRILSLPLFAEMTASQWTSVAQGIADFCQ
jgi:dTDP-4-amino-4,6-dideoxygalactose transaminase